MSDRPWKQAERKAAALFGGRRIPASQGGPVDFVASDWVGQVKLVKRMSLAELEYLALEIERVAAESGAYGALVVKRRAGAGRPTPRLIVLTEATWRRAFGVPGPGAGGRAGTRPSRGSHGKGRDATWNETSLGDQGGDSGEGEIVDPGASEGP